MASLIQEIIKAVDWLCTKIENGQTSLILDIQEFEEE